jgi:hypothetical protein
MGKSQRKQEKSTERSDGKNALGQGDDGRKNAPNLQGVLA